MFTFTIFLVTFTSLLSPVEPVKTQNPESRLFKSLLDGYNPHVRPVLNPEHAVPCNMSVTLTSINQIEEKRQTISVNLWITLVWNDENIKWDPEEYGNITEIRLDSTLIWTPDIHLYNKAAIDDGNSNTGIQNSQYRVLIYSSGQILFVPSVSLKATCPMHMTWFPFDSQTCTLKFGSWTYSSAQVDLQLYKRSVEFDSKSFVENGEWQLLSHSTKREEVIYPCCTESYIHVDFKMTLKRRPLYYFFNLIIPCALIGFLALLGFTLPPDSKEKLTLGVTLLFSLILFLNVISESMPTNSNSVPLMGVYFNCVMLIIAMSVVSTIIVNLKLDKELPFCVKFMCLKCLGPLTKMDPPHSLDNSRGRGRNRNPNYMIDKPMITNPSGENRIQMEWNYVALVVDRFCLMLSLGVTTVAMIWAMLRAD